MYEPITNFYPLVVQSQTRRITWGGTITADGIDYPFTAENIVGGSGRIINEISGSVMELGTVYSSELDIGIYIDDIGVPRDKIYGATILLECTMTANNTTGTVPMGVFTVVEAKQSGAVCSIVAYDGMSAFDVEYPIESGAATPYDWAVQFCVDCGVSLSTTKAQFEAMPNGTVNLMLTWSDSIDTYRTAIGMLAAAIGCSAHMNRNGLLEFYPLKNIASVATVRANDRFSSGIAQISWSPSSIYVTNSETGKITKVGNGSLVFDLGDNRFLQSDGYTRNIEGHLNTRVSVASMLTSILSTTHSVSVVPIDADIPLNPCLDLFDIITLTGAQANNTKVLITSMIHTIGGATEIKCAGANTTDEPKDSSRGSEGKRDDWLWISGNFNVEEKNTQTDGQTWQDQLSTTWGALLPSTWGGLLNGGDWVMLEEIQRYFSTEFTLGVVALTTEYEVSQDTDVSFKVNIARLDGLNYVTVSEWVCIEHALKGKHTASMVSPFGILDRQEGTLYRIAAYMSGVDVVDSLRILTKAEIQELISGGESE